MKRVFYAIFGLFCVLLAIIGAILPVMPSIPFSFMAIYCFAQVSTRFHNWIIASKIYKKYFAPIKDKVGMTLQKKLLLCLVISLALIVSSIFVWRFWYLLPFLFFFGLANILYFLLGVPTISREKEKTYNEKL